VFVEGGDPMGWLRRAVVAISFCGVATVLLPWMRTDVSEQDGIERRVAYHNGIPSSTIEGKAIGWNGIIASVIFFAATFGALLIPSNRDRLLAISGLAAAVVLMVISGSFFATADPVARTRGVELIKGIQFSISVGPYAVFLLALALAVASTSLLRNPRGSPAL
jgi:hypothetical protein